MTASIVLTGLAANDPVPGVYMEVAFAQGTVAGSSITRAILIIANKLTTGSAVADSTIYGPETDPPLQSEDHMIGLGGDGSEAHRMFKRITAVNKDTAVYCLFVTPSAGTAATGTITITTTATGTGVHRTYVGDEFVEASIATGNTVTTIAAAIVAAINAKTSWPVTAANVAGVVTLTAKTPGPRGNWIRFKASITSGIGSATTATTDAFLASGATADSNTTALATILARSFYYIASAAEDATQLGALVSQVNTQAAPTTGIRQRVFGASIDTLANAITVATGVNSPRAEIVWHEKSPWTPAELAANAAAVYALFESNETNPETNFIEFGTTTQTQPYWKVPRSRIDTAAPTRPSVKAALNAGLSPIAVATNGATYLVNRITTRSLSGSTPDYRIRGAHKVTICDFFTDALGAKVKAQTAGNRIANDPPKGGRQPGPKVSTPDRFRSIISSVLRTFEDNDLLQNVDQIKAGTKVQREENPSTRMGAYIPLQPIDNHEQSAIFVAQVA